MLPNETYTQLLTLRTELRRFMLWSEQQAAAAGLTAAQHQLLLAIRGHPDPRGPTVGEIADYLLLRQNSAGGLITRAGAAGLIIRERDPVDQRVVRLRLTDDAAQRLEALSALHLQELERLSVQLPHISAGLDVAHQPHGAPTVRD